MKPPLLLDLVDYETKLKYRGIVKAIVEKVGLDVMRVAEIVCKLGDKSEDVGLLAELVHACKLDSVTWDELGELVYAVRNPYVRYDEKAYKRTREFLETIFND